MDSDQKPRIRTGGQILVDQLVIHGTDVVFCVPGESFLAALDAFQDAADSIQLVTCRHEAAACTMAEAYGKLTGRPGVCFVTRGPGSAHAMVGVLTAHEDRSPLILLVGQVARGFKERGALQEIDTRAMFGHLAKWSADINDPARIPEMVSHAFHVAVAGRSGPVVLGLPEDMLTDACTARDGAAFRSPRLAPRDEDLDRFRALLADARKPLVVVGGGGWTGAAVEALKTFAERFDLPVAASFRCQDLMDNRHQSYVGDLSLAVDPDLAQQVRAADLVIAIGAPLGELPTQGYTLLDPPRPDQRLVHVLPDPDELGSVYQADLPIAAHPETFLARAVRMKPAPVRWQEWRRRLRTIYETALTPGPCPGRIDLGRAMAALSEAAPRDVLVTSDGGNFAGWVNRFFQLSAFRSLLGPANGAMGYGLPAAITAKLIHPERPVLCFAGDGGFMMSASELATAMLYDVAVTVIVFNNGMYGTIRMYQEKEYPSRHPGTTLQNPDFAAFARSFGAEGVVVEETDAFVPAVASAIRSGKLSVIEVRYDPEAITTRTTLSRIRERARLQDATG